MTFDWNHKYNFPYFVLNESVIEDTFKSDDKVFCVDEQESLLNEIKSIIENSKEYLKICSFLLDDEEIFELLKKKLTFELFPIFIITTINDRDLVSNFLNEIEEPNSETIKRHLDHIQELYLLGAHIRAGSDLHAKFIISDYQKCIITSANLSPFSLRENTEVGIRVEIDEVILVEQMFDIIYRYYTEYPKFDEHFIRESEKKNAPDLIRYLPQKNKQDRFTFTFDKANYLYDSIKKIIDLAIHDINIASYSLNKLENLMDLYNLLLKKINEGVRINIFVRANERYLTGIAKDLINAGIKIYADSKNHAKGIVTDDKFGLFFSANIDGQYGLTNGFEVAYKFLNNHDNFNQFNNFIKNLVASAPFEVSTQPTLYEISKFYNKNYLDKGINYKGNYTGKEFEFIFQSESEARNFYNDISQNIPFYYPGKQNEQNNYLLIGLGRSNFYLFQVQSSKMIFKGLKKETFLKWKYIFDIKSIKIKSVKK